MGFGLAGSAVNAGAGLAASVGGPLAGQLAAAVGTSILAAFMNDRQDYQVQFGFRVEIDGIISGAFRTAGPFKWTTEVDAIREGGRNNGTVNLVKPGKFAPLVLNKGLVVNNSELFEWMRRLHDHSQAFHRANMSVIMVQEDGSERGRFNLYNAFPSRYELGQFDGKSNDVSVETLEITFDYFHFLEM